MDEIRLKEIIKSCLGPVFEIRYSLPQASKISGIKYAALLDLVKCKLIEHNTINGRVYVTLNALNAYLSRGSTTKGYVQETSNR